MDKGAVGGEEMLSASLCSYAPVGDFMICCENEQGEDIDCTAKTEFEAGEKVTIVINPEILENIEAPYVLCESSDLLLSVDVPLQGSDDADAISCIEILPEMESFVVRKEGFVPSLFSNGMFSLIQLTTVKEGELSSPQALLDINRKFTQ